MNIRLGERDLSRECKELTGGGLFPRLCYLVPDEKRAGTLTDAILKVLRDYNIPKFPCWLSTFDEMDIFSIDQGRVTDVQLVKPWVSERGRLVASPLI